MVYASFSSRFSAFIIDYLIISIPLSLIWYFIHLPVPTRGIEIGNFIIFPSIIAWLISVFYYGIMESSLKQATFGKMILGIKVTGKGGEKLSFRRAGARTLHKFISSILLLGYVMFFFNKRKQALHDWLTNSIVVKK